jgi:hypothetical protein
MAGLILIIDSLFSSPLAESSFLVKIFERYPNRHDALSFFISVALALRRPVA